VPLFFGRKGGMANIQRLIIAFVLLWSSFVFADGVVPSQAGYKIEVSGYSVYESDTAQGVCNQFVAAWGAKNS
jgi:hypothetical protein